MSIFKRNNAKATKETKKLPMSSNVKKGLCSLFSCSISFSKSKGLSFGNLLL